MQLFSARKKRWRLLKVFLISFFAILLVAVGIGLVWSHHNIRPPVISNPLITTGILIAEETNVEDIRPTLYTPSEPEEIVEIPIPLDLEGWERRPNFFTVLLFGLDEGFNADVIMVAAFDAETQQGYIISIPRDTRVDVQRNNRKIVSAYAVGRLRGGGHTGGVEQLKREVQTLLGFRPDFYVSVQYELIVSIVDAIGGLEIYVPFHKHYSDPYQDLYINIPAGLQRLNGQDVLHFARFRYFYGRARAITDYERIENQQQVLNELLQELITPRTLRRVPALVRAYNNYMTTNLSLGEQLWFALQLNNIGSVSALSTYTLPMRGTSGRPSWYELPNRDGIVTLVNRTVNPFTQDITADMLRIAP